MKEKLMDATDFTIKELPKKLREDPDIWDKVFEFLMDQPFEDFNDFKLLANRFQTNPKGA